MSTVWNKLESGLSAIYADYLHVRERGLKAVPPVHAVVAGGGRLNVSPQYTGDLAEIEALGFQTAWEEVTTILTPGESPMSLTSFWLEEKKCC